MPRYKDADALLTAAHHLPYSVNGAAWLQAIENTPTADVVPVVRCCECKRSQVPPVVEGGQVEYLYCTHPGQEKGDPRLVVDFMDYCSHGERRRLKND